MRDIELLEKMKLILLENMTTRHTEDYIEYAEIIDKCKKLLEENDSVNTFKPGETIIYQNGNSFEIGIVKRVCENGDCFVNYHTCDTAARTPQENMHKIRNLYAFHVYRLNTNDEEIK